MEVAAVNKLCGSKIIEVMQKGFKTIQNVKINNVTGSV